MSAETPVTESSVWNTLMQLVTHSKLGVDSQVPKLFDLLIHQLAGLGEQQLVKIFDQLQEKHARKYMLDALPLVGSAGSVQAMYQIYAAREVSRDELESWLTALSFHKQPSLEILDTLQLFMQDGYHPKTWLAVSSVVHSYCRLDPACADTPQVHSYHVCTGSRRWESLASRLQENSKRLLW
ncbi:uncharacterized protein LOC124374520 [Homalodisca vitripennis]|uniref:uncharacterized protein LOC124374520 n=1 Tax=Homalodisca vitripennis TaxID=197043 RepID=UPI001EEA8F55|nr:uncharacterized protein LOC124374520 [Homalodisca vitripennis]